MASSPKIYTRLTSALGAGTYSSLWLGSDHLMIVRSNGYSENYARLELRDIKGLFITDSERRGWWLTIWGILGLLDLIIVVNNIAAGEMPWISGGLLVATIGFMLWNHLLGAGCRVYAATGVQTAELPSLVRRRKARRVLGRLQPLIEAAQADLIPAPSPAPVPPPPTVP